MKRRLLFIFGMIACWASSYAQVPEYLYYKFDDSTTIVNYASNPQGNQNIPVPANLSIDTVGFQDSYALSGTGESAQGGVETGFYPDYSKSFTIAFWYQNDSIDHSKQQCIDIFEDTLSGYSCAIATGFGVSRVLVNGEGGLSLNIGLSTVPLSQGIMVHIVYNAEPTAADNYGSQDTYTGLFGNYTLYINGISAVGPFPVEVSPLNQSSGIVIGSNVGSTTGCEGNSDIWGRLDEFRWYGRALTETEIWNTLGSDLIHQGVCTAYTEFKIDSISGNAVRISWVPGAGNDSFFLEYDTTGFTPGTGTRIIGSYPSSQIPIILSGLLADTEYDVYFGEYCNEGSDTVYNPLPQTFKTTPLCPTPVHIDFLTTGESFVEISWEHTGPENVFYITYGPQGFDTATYGITDTAVSIPHIIDDLDPETIYDFYVYTDCGNGYGNSIVVKRSMRTDCGIKTAPFFEDFQDSTWGLGIVGSSVMEERNDTINNCWNRDGGARVHYYDYDWELYSAPLAGKSGNQFLVTGGINGVNYAEGDQAIIYTPFIDISSVNYPYLSFYYYRQFMHGAGNTTPFLKIQPDLYVEVNDGKGWKVVKKITGYEQLNESVTSASGGFFQLPAPDPFKSVGVDLSGFGDTVQVRFRAVNLRDSQAGGCGITAIDDFSIDEAPECPDIFDVKMGHINTDTSVVFDIESLSNSFHLEWGPRGFEQGTGCSGSFSGSYLLDSCIIPNQDMDLYVQDCNDAEWKGPYPFCGPRTSPYFTDFDEHAIKSSEFEVLRNAACWDKYSSGKNSEGDIVKIFPDAYYWNISPDERLNSKLNIYNHSVSEGDTIIAISPAFIDLTDGNKQVRFEAMLENGSNLLNGDILIIGTMSDPKSGKTFKAIDTIMLVSNHWKEYCIKLDAVSGYNGADIYVGLKPGNGVKNIFIDNFNYEEIPTCIPPVFGSLKTTEIWNEAVTVSWSDTTGKPTILGFGEEGFDPDNDNFERRIVFTDTFYHITGLMPATTYNLYIRDSCDLDNHSRWIGPITFKTLCNPFIAPFFEDFDGIGWFPAPGHRPYGSGGNYENIGDSIHLCWRRNIEPGTNVYPNYVDSLRYPWTERYHTWGISKGLYAGGHYGYGVAKDYSGIGNYAFSIIYRPLTLTGKEEAIGDLYSPLIDISALNHPYLTFYYHRYGSERIPDFWVEVNDGSVWDTVKYYAGPEASQTSQNSPYYQSGIDLSGFSDTIQIRFRSLYQHSYSAEGFTAIDNIEVKEAPPCIKPDGLEEEHYINVTSGNWRSILKWEHSASLTDGYEIVIGSPGFDPDSIAQVNRIYVPTADSLLLDTLQAGECYEFMIRSVCASGDTSDYSNRYAFCLPCIDIAPLVENFDLFKKVESFDNKVFPTLNGESYHPCWYYQSTAKPLGENYDYNYYWTAGTDIGDPWAGTGASIDADTCSAGQFLYTWGSGTIDDGGDSTVFYSPLIDIRNLVAPELSFAYYMYGIDIKALHVDIYDGIKWHNNVISLIGQQQSATNTYWKDTAVSIGMYNSTGFVQVRYRAKRFYGNDCKIAIDNFRISEPINCPAPRCFHVRNSTDSTVILSWQPPAGVHSFEVEYGFRNFTYGEGIKVSTNRDSLGITVGLNRLYDAYIRSICSDGDSSLVVGPVPFQSTFLSCDDFEGYTLGSLTHQSGLFYSYNAVNETVDRPNVGFEWRGDEEISDIDAHSGLKSLRLHENGSNGGSSVVALLEPPIGSDFDEMTRNVFAIDFSFSVNDTGGGYYDILPGVRRDFRDRLYNIGDLGFRFNPITMSWEAFNRNDASIVIHSFRYETGWNELRHIIDIDNDSVWMVLNGMDMQVGWKYTVGNGGTIATWGPGGPPIKQLEGVRFLTTPQNLNNTTRASEFFIDDFCVSPYECPLPSEITLNKLTCSTASLNWIAGQLGAKTTIEYGVSGFVRGSGDTVLTFSNSYKLDSLSPGETYDVYVQEICGFDTVSSGPVTITLPTEATADFTYIAYAAGTEGTEGVAVDFDASGSSLATKYIWTFHDSVTINGETVRFTFLENGTYDVQLIIESDCGNDTITKTIGISGIGLEENILSQSLEVYPNPFTDNVQISFDTQSSEDAVLRLTDPSGKVILQKRASNINGSYSGEMDLGHLAKGTYMLRIECGEVSAVKRIVRN